LRQDSLAKRLMTVQVITQHSHPPSGIMRAPSRQPALGGGRFAILFLLTVLRLHERPGGKGTTWVCQGATSTGMMAVCRYKVLLLSVWRVQQGQALFSEGATSIL